jgi:lincosamide and streptogramin A transport system ATP-binding/permease protein
MALIKVSDLTFSYFGSNEKIFENVSFQIDTDWKLGFIGRNGRGKTTFLNLLLGKFEYEGKIISPVEFKYFPQTIENKTLESINLAYTLNPYLELWQLEKELSLLDLSKEILYRQFNTLSNGEQTKFLLAMLFTNDNHEFLLIDEPTNHLDENARKIVANYLNSKKGFILVSHDRMLLDNCVDHILSINRANIEIQSGNFSSWYYNKEMQDGFELAENEKLKKEMKRLNQSMQRTSNWAQQIEKSKYGNGPIDRGFIGHKSAKMMKRSKHIEKRQQALYEEKSNLLNNLEEVENLKITPLSHHSDNLVIFENISIQYDKTVCENINFVIKNGDKIVLKGKNGSGKSSIIKLICEENINYTGNLYKANNLIISYVSQDTSFLKGYVDDFARLSKIDVTLFKTILRKLDFSREHFEKNMKDYSAGQKKKVLIAKSLCEQAHIYIWDEPLNYIDVFSRIQIENLLLNAEITLLFVEHDNIFSNNIKTDIINLK